MTSRSGDDETPPTRSSSCSIWGVLNITPDSFSDGGRFVGAESALAHARRMLAEGADVIDVGGESTRPAGLAYGAGFAPVSAEEEAERVVGVIAELVGSAGVRVSIDTTKALVAERALSVGAVIINDVSCGRSEDLLRVAATGHAELVLMHNRGRGEVAAPNTVYRDVVSDVIDELLAAAQRAQRAGVQPDRIWLDPGIGFAKTATQSAALLAGLPRLVETGHRVLVGASRKSFVAELCPNADGSRPAPEARLAGSLVAATRAAAAGCHAVRVHDVAATRQALLVAQAIESAEQRP